MRAVALRRFFDIDKNVMREKGEAFECTSKRFTALNSTKWGALVMKAPKKDKERK